jgi:predicted nucleic acid-binding protein
MSHLTDTNILLRSIQKSHAMFKEADAAVKALLGFGEILYVTSQNVIEFWAVATRPVGNNGLGLTVEDAARELAGLKTIVSILPDTPDILTEWEKLVVQHRVSGKQAHDARIVAAMKVHGVTHLLTFNTDDFKRYTGIAAVHPASIAAP